MVKKKETFTITSGELWFLIIIAAIAGLALGAMISDLWRQADNDVKELGQAICDQEYDMDYKSYYGKDLTCQPKEIEKVMAYDGITLNLDEDRKGVFD